MDEQLGARAPSPETFCAQRLDGAGSDAQDFIHLTERYGARNYAPLPVVIAKGEGVWLYDVNGERYLDMLSAYSAASFGHCNPRIISAMTEQAANCTLTSRAFYSDKLGQFLKAVCELSRMDMALPMNTGAEAVETAIKVARKWGYVKKGVPVNQAEIIVFGNNFHGRTTTIISFSSEPSYREHFGPHTPGFVVVPYGDFAAVERAINANTVAVLVEPIQGEGGIVLPGVGFLRDLHELCRERNVLFVADEIQTGLGRTGKMFALDHENIHPDMYILGKALGGGVYPVSVVTSPRHIMEIIRPGDHGSTFGGNHIAAAIGITTIAMLQEPGFVDAVMEKGAAFMRRLQSIVSPDIAEIRGQGFLIGIVLQKHLSARPYCEALLRKGLLCKETKENVIRIAPPLVITQQELDWAFEQIAAVFA